jgi:hypothetical protein
VQVLGSDPNVFVGSIASRLDFDMYDWSPSWLSATPAVTSDPFTAPGQTALMTRRPSGREDESSRVESRAGHEGEDKERGGQGECNAVIHRAQVLDSGPQRMRPIAMTQEAIASRPMTCPEGRRSENSPVATPLTMVITPNSNVVKSAFADGSDRGSTRTRGSLGG